MSQSPSRADAAGAARAWGVGRRAGGVLGSATFCLSRQDGWTSSSGADETSSAGSRETARADIAPAKTSRVSTRAEGDSPIFVAEQHAPQGRHTNRDSLRRAAIGAGQNQRRCRSSRPIMHHLRVSWGVPGSQPTLGDVAAAGE